MAQQLPKRGSTVKHKSGKGFEMTILSVSPGGKGTGLMRKFPAKEPSVTCQWFDDNGKLHKKKFHPDDLIVIKTP